MAIAGGEATWGVDPNSPDDVKVKRTMTRGTIVSIISALFLNAYGAWALNFKNDNPETQKRLTLFFGFLFGPIVGFMLDIGIGTDEGYAMGMSKHGGSFGLWLSNLFASLCTSNFA